MILKLYRVYRNKIYPRISDKRGATRLLIMLRELNARGLEKAPEQEVESIKDRQWDNLIILDACRHDLYEEVNGPTDYRITPVSQTPDFVETNFGDDETEDLIYISANPFLSERKFKELTGTERSFTATYETFNTDWDDKEGVVLPESVVKDALSAEKLFPDKRKIIHFMQPHVPFLEFENSENPWKENKDSEWDLAAKGEIEDDLLWRKYKENLERIMPHVEELTNELSGKTVITSDHGNLVGENGLYGHPGHLNLKLLRKVPWDVKKEIRN